MTRPSAPKRRRPLSYPSFRRSEALLLGSFASSGSSVGGSSLGFASSSSSLVGASFGSFDSAFSSSFGGFASSCGSFGSGIASGFGSFHASVGSFFSGRFGGGSFFSLFCAASSQGQRECGNRCDRNNALHLELPSLSKWLIVSPKGVKHVTTVPTSFSQAPAVGRAHLAPKSCLCNLFGWDRRRSVTRVYERVLRAIATMACQAGLTTYKDFFI